jgi:hypothetical protein
MTSLKKFYPLLVLTVIVPNLLSLLHFGVLRLMYTYPNGSLLFEGLISQQLQRWAPCSRALASQTQAMKFTRHMTTCFQETRFAP